MKQPKLFEFVKKHEFYEDIKPIFENDNFPFDATDFGILDYIRELCQDQYEDLKKIDGFYNDDDLSRREIPISHWDYWESIIYQFETVVNHWVKVRLKPYINGEGQAPIHGNISWVTVFDEHDVNIYVQRVRGKNTRLSKEFFGLGLYDPIFEIAKIDWTRQEVHLRSTYSQLDMLDSYDPMNDHPALKKES